MCLLKKKRFPKFSTKPIEVYKVLRIEYSSCSCNYFTPFMRRLVKLNSVIKARDTNWSEMLCYFFIEGCGVHAFVNKKEAFDYVDSPKYCIVKAIIPPFTFYWEGEEGDIAARKLFITDKIITNESI